MGLNDPDAGAVPRRKRFQFSLRVLIILVILFGTAWLITLKFGANKLAWEMARKHATRLAKDGRVMKRTGDGQVTVTGIDRILMFLHATQPDSNT